MVTAMTDKIEKLLNSTIQHGPLNDRIYLLHLDERDAPDIIPALENLAKANHYTKILTKMPVNLGSFFIQRGYIQEARIPDFFNDGQALVFLSKFMTAERFQEQNPEQIRQVNALAQDNLKASHAAGRNRGHDVQACTPEDAVALSRLFAQVFQTYPFPVFEPAYLIQMMAEHTLYLCIRHQGRMIAAAAAESDAHHPGVEMTDFAVLPAWRGQGCASALLAKMETAMKRRGKRVSFTIARTRSLGINRLFKGHGHRFAGVLTNNTNIAGGIESMTVWFRKL